MELLEACELIVDCPHSTAKDEGAGYPLIRTPNVGRGRLMLDNVHRVSESVYHKRNERAIPQENDLILAREAPIGNVALIRHGQNVCLGQRTVLIRPNSKLVDPEFLVYYLLSPCIQHILRNSANGATVSHLNMSDIRKLEIMLPPLNVQRRIGQTISRLDDKISINTEINQNLAEQAEALFKERFLSYEDLPLGWKMMTLGDISDMGAGGDKPKIISDQKTETYQYPIYSNGISDEGLYGFTSDYKISSESVTVSARGTIGFVCLRHIPYTPIVRLVTLVPHTDVVSAKYLYLWLKNIPIHGTGTTQQQLTVPDFRKTEIVIPTEAEMREFTETVDPLFQQIWANQKENSSLADIRDTLLPRLMSGEIDVSKLVD